MSTAWTFTRWSVWASYSARSSSWRSSTASGAQSEPIDCFARHGFGERLFIKRHVSFLSPGDRRCLKAKRLGARRVLLFALLNRRGSSSCGPAVNDPLRQSDGLSMSAGLFDVRRLHEEFGSAYSTLDLLSKGGLPRRTVCHDRRALSRNGPPQSKVSSARDVGQCKHDGARSNFAPSQQDEKRAFLPQEVAKWIDERSRFAFPLAFLAANAIYWSLIWA